MLRKILVLISAGFLFFGCKKEEVSKSSNTPTVAPGVTENDGAEIVVSGQIDLAKFSDIGEQENTPNTVYVLGGDTSETGEGYSASLLIDEEGTFKAELTKESSQTSFALDSECRDESRGRVYNYLLVAAKGPEAGLSMSDENDIDDRITISETFKYIGMPAGDDNLVGLQAGSAKGDFSLGKISPNDGEEEMMAELAADTTSYALSEATITNFANADGVLKLNKNTFINPTLSVQPFYFWQISGRSQVEGQYNDASAPTYVGYGFYIGVEDAPFTFEGLCDQSQTSQKLIELLPPVGQTVSTQNGSRNAASPFNNRTIGNLDLESSSPSCSGSETGFYLRKDTYDGRVSYMINWGTGGSIEGEMPSGYWTLKYEGDVLGKFEMATASPLDSNGNPVVFVPMIKVTTDGSNVSEVKIKFSKWDNNKYVEIEDAEIFEKLTNELSFTIDKDSGENRFALKNPNNGTFTLSGTAKAMDDCATIASLSLSDFRAYALSYVIGNTSFRWEVR